MNGFLVIFMILTTRIGQFFAILWASSDLAYFSQEYHRTLSSEAAARITPPLFLILIIVNTAGTSILIEKSILGIGVQLRDCIGT